MKKATTKLETERKEVNVQVVVRSRPINAKEKSEGGLNNTHVVRCNPKKSEILVSPPKGQPKTYTFDAVFGETTTQKELYDSVLAQMVDEVLKGFNCTIFAYGQTGTGKTYTMEGSKTDPSGMGVIPRSIHYIFDALRQKSCEDDAKSIEWTVRVSHLELYNEELIDLLCPSPANAPPLRIFESSTNGDRSVTIQNLEEAIVSDADEILKLIEASTARRQTAETNMNKQSSRSHCIFTITIHIKESSPDGEDLVKIGKLNLVDLAGSENVGRSGALGGRKREAGMINQSLLTLGRVINALVDHSPHVPYRESKLTRLLQESLGGRAKTLIIATISPSATNLEETLSTLDYANRAKNIRNKPEINATLSKRAIMKEYTHEIEILKLQLAAARKKDGIYLPEAMYQEMQTTIQKQKAEIEQYEETIEAKNREISVKNENLVFAKRENENLKARVKTLEGQLEESQRIAQERADRIAQLEEIEKDLQSRIKMLFESLRESIDEIEALHSKVGRQTSTEMGNLTRRDAFLTNKLTALIDSFKTRSSVLINEVSAKLKEIYQGVDKTASIEEDNHKIRSMKLDELAKAAEVQINAIDALMAENRNELAQYIAILSESQSLHATRSCDLIVSSILGSQEKSSECRTEVQKRQRPEEQVEAEPLLKRQRSGDQAMEASSMEEEEVDKVTEEVSEKEKAEITPATIVLARMRTLLADATSAINELSSASSKYLSEFEAESRKMVASCATALSKTVDYVEKNSLSTADSSRKRIEELEALVTRSKEARKKAHEAILEEVAKTLTKHFEAANKELEDEITDKLTKEIAQFSANEEALAKQVASVNADWNIQSKADMLALSNKMQFEWFESIDKYSSLAVAPVTEASTEAQQVSDSLTQLTEDFATLQHQFEESHNTSLVTKGTAISEWLREAGNKAKSLGTQIANKASQIKIENSQLAMDLVKSQIALCNQQMTECTAEVEKLKKVANDESNNIHDGVYNFCLNEIKENRKTGETPMKKKRVLNPSILGFHNINRGSLNFNQSPSMKTLPKSKSLSVFQEFQHNENSAPRNINV